MAAMLDDRNNTNSLLWEKNIFHAKIFHCSCQGHRGGVQIKLYQGFVTRELHGVCKIVLSDRPNTAHDEAKLLKRQ